MRIFLFLSILAPTVFSTLLSDTAIRESSVSRRETSDQSSHLENRDEDTTYMAWATDPTNENELKETREFLNNTVVDKNQWISYHKVDGKSAVWGGLTLDDAALKKVQAYPKLKDVMIEPEVEDDLVISRGDEDSLPASYKDDKMIKRAPSDWAKQDPAPKNLALIGVEK
jgi:hypothetical protein